MKLGGDCDELVVALDSDDDGKVMREDVDVEGSRSW